jgi:putative ABC transport system permease protein
MILNALNLAIREMRRSLMRSSLTVLGIVIGVSAVITMVSLGNGATKSISQQISSLGSNLLILSPGQRPGPGGSGQTAPTLKISDATAIQSQITGLKAVAPTASQTVNVVAGGKNWTTSVTGTTNDYFVSGNWRIAEGRLFTDTEQRAGKAVCILGETVRRKLFGNQTAIGNGLRLKTVSCEVIGLLSPKGQASMGRDQDDVLVTTLRTFQRRISGRQDVNSILISASDTAATEKLKRNIGNLMRQRRHTSAGGEDDFNVLDTKEIAAALSGTTRVLTALLGAVAAVSLLVGGIGIMNIMLVSITERTREIGTRLAIGAREREVLLQFLVESVTLSCFGGVIGIALATIATLCISRLMQVPYVFNTQINALAFVFSAVIGVSFGYIPATRAARLDPIEALRHE